LTLVPGGKATAPSKPDRRDDEKRAQQEAARQQRLRDAEERKRDSAKQKAAGARARKEVEDLAARLTAARQRLREVRRSAKASSGPERPRKPK
jgi:hypothetical protein